MGQILDALHRLQDVERELVRLRNENAQKERTIAATRRQIRQLDEQVTARQNEVQQQLLKAQRLESEIRQREEQVARLRQQLNVTRTTREYAAILTEINTEKADTTKIEEQALAALQAVDQAKAALAEIQQQRDVLVARLEKANEALQRFHEASREPLAELEKRKEELATDLPITVLRTFERVADYHEGDALANVVRIHPKRDEFGCGGCHMSITAEQVNAIMSRDDLQMCNNCGRILYVETELQQQQRRRDAAD